MRCTVLERLCPTLCHSSITQCIALYHKDSVPRLHHSVHCTIPERLCPSCVTALSLHAMRYSRKTLFHLCHNFSTPCKVLYKKDCPICSTSPSLSTLHCTRKAVPNVSQTPHSVNCTVPPKKTVPPVSQLHRSVQSTAPERLCSICSTAPSHRALHS